MNKDKTDEVFQLIVDIEKQGHEILNDKSEIIALDRRRNSNREALRALKKEVSPDKTLMSFGPNLIKLPREETIKLLEKDQATIHIEINKLQSGLKDKVNKLQELEYKPQLSGFSLKALSKQEFTAMKQTWGEKS